MTSYTYKKASCPSFFVCLQDKKQTDAVVGIMSRFQIKFRTIIL